MENVLSLLTSLDDSEIQTIQTFLKARKKDREIERRMEKYTERLKLQGLGEREIESNKICKLRVMGVIDMDEAIRRLTELYNK